jgi:hypothetical protein
MEDHVFSEPAVNDERRNTFRAASQESEICILRIGRRVYRGVIRDESAGGYSFFTTMSLHAEPQADAELLRNGHACAVRIIYARSSSLTTRVGLQRLETFEKSRSGKPTGSLKRTLWMYALAAAGGLGIGLLLVRTSWLG